MVPYAYPEFKCFGYETVISQLAESGINALCLDFRGIDESVSDVCSDYVQILNGNKMPPDPSERGNSRKISRGHFFKGVL